VKFLYPLAKKKSIENWNLPEPAPSFLFFSVKKQDRGREGRAFGHRGNPRGAAGGRLRLQIFDGAIMLREEILAALQRGEEGDKTPRKKNGGTRP
jgi:hypothetical protein